MSEKTLIVFIDSWDDKVIKITFHNPIGFIYKAGSFVFGLYEIISENDFMKEVLTLHYQNIPDLHPFKTFAIMDIEDLVFFEIVAENVSVIKS